MIDFAGADGENLANELSAHKVFKNLADLESIDGHSEKNKIRKWVSRICPRLGRPWRIGRYEAEIFDTSVRNARRCLLPSATQA